jgi:hypothetical protein
MVTAEIDTTDLDRVLKAIPPAVQTAVRQELTKQAILIQQEARRKHRYTSRSGRLNQAVKTSVDSSGMSSEVFIESDIADYGLYIVEGHGSWEPDQFLDEATQTREKEIEDSVTRAIESAVGGV